MTVYDVSLQLRANDRTVFDALHARWPPRAIATTSPTIDFVYSVLGNRAGAEDGEQPGYAGYAGDLLFSRTDELADLCATFEAIVRFHVAMTTPNFTFIHAGVVGHNGHAIVMPAPAMSGKSRLTLALVEAGATYYSDEVAVLDRDGLVHPYRIPASIRSDGSGAMERWPLQASHDEPPPIPIAMVVSTRYAADARWQPRQGTRGEALTALLSNTTRARVRPRDVLPVLARAVERAAFFDGPRGEADETARRLLAAAEPRPLPAVE
jgi:hypothetical protein